MRRYVYGWLCWCEGFRKARRKRHGAGPSSLRQALRIAACYRFVADGQHRTPPRLPRYLR